MKLFKTPTAILDEISQMQTAENFRREDRATVSEFFNGAPPLSDAEAEELGFTVNVNNLFGYSELADAKDQMFALFHKPSRLLEVELDVAEPGKRMDWGLKAQAAATTVLKKITPLKSAYEGCAGDTALHGEAVMFFPNCTFPTPKQVPLSKMLVPDSASTDSTELSRFAIETEMELKDLRHYWEHASDDSDWKKANLGKILKGIYKDCLTDGAELDTNNVEDAEYRRQENSASKSSRKTSVQVYYFYQQRCDLFGSPLDLTIIAKNDPNSDVEVEAKHRLLYEGEGVYPTIHKCLHPFFMDCMIGGQPKWHRVLGLGHLNYQLNHATELLINRAMQATIEGSMNLWQARDSSTREEVEKILLKHNGVIPENLSLLPNRFAPNFAGILEMIQFFRQQGSKNASGVTPNNGDSNDQLEVQSMFEQNKGASRSNSRTSNLYDYQDRMWTEVFARLTNPYIDTFERGYSEVKDFQGEMRRHGIPLRYLQPVNVQVRAVRLIGDGLRAKELAAANYLTQNRAAYAPEVQPRITRITTALALDNYALAEELTPTTEESDNSPQQIRAESENAIMLTQRKALKPNAEDVDELHIMAHFPALERLLADGLQYQKGAFVPPQAEAFQVIGGHIVMHVQRIEAKAMQNRNDPEREKARAFMEQLNAMAAMGEKLTKQMQAAQTGQQKEIDPTEMAKLQLQVEVLTHQREKLNFSMKKFERTQGTREQALAFDQMLKLEQDRRGDRRESREGAQRDTELALKIATAGQGGRR